MKKLLRAAILVLVGSALSAQDRPGSWVRGAAQHGDFPLVDKGAVADLIVSPEDFRVVSLAAANLATDIARVSGRTPERRGSPDAAAGAVVIIGTVGKSPVVDALVSAGKFDASTLRGAWESFLIATVDKPFPGVARALVIAGSDRRGTAFGVYELSQAIGVSPWYWWADVTPTKRATLFVARGTRRFGPPSVKYRGIFLNDEDWGLKPWAAKTFGPETGDIGPKTYARLFELMLRLKANTVWPAMHATTRPFNSFPENKRVADDHAIVMGSSHAEPMLRNNVGEWKAPPESYNYVTNRQGVRAYWEERVRENGAFENIYTLGMRGIHDSNMQGPRTDPDRIRTLQEIFTDQRAMLARHVRPEVERIPQMFCAYKEVLSLYRQGLKVPHDVTIVWPDDNHGYIRNYANAEERKRSGGFGVYYHLSYLGAPMSYLWLSTTPPAVIWSEMNRAFDHGARTIWIANVGDLKPAEIGTEFFLQMAWDITRWRRENLPAFLVEWATREFGSGVAKDIATIQRDYYQLNYQRRPEHLQWWLPRESPRASPLTPEESTARLNAFIDLRHRMAAVRKKVPAEKLDAFFQLVGYPVEGSALANLRFIAGERGESEAARAADSTLRQLTDDFNERLAGGKWRGVMSLEPADAQWRSMRIAPWTPPAYSPPPAPSASGEGFIAIEAERFTRKTDRPGVAWDVVPGLGRIGDSVTLFPTTAPPIDVDRLTTGAPRLDYALTFPTAGEFTVSANLAPTHPIIGPSLRFAVALDDASPHLVALEVKDGGPDWAQGVLNATRVATTTITVPTPGAHTLRIFGVDPGVVLDRLVIGPLGHVPPGYLGPADTRKARVSR